MAKTTTYIAIFTALFIISMLFAIAFPLDWINNDINEIYINNQGRFWLMGIVLTTFGSVMLFIVAYYQVINRELTLLLKEETQKNASLQQTYINQLRDLSLIITESVSDVKELTGDIETLTKRIEQNEEDIKSLKTRRGKRR